MLSAAARGEPAAFFVLSVMPEPCYDEIKDGKWTAEMPACVLHRSAVAGKYRGSGMAERLMLFVERQARAFGLRCIRTDTHKKNKPMRTFCGRADTDTGEMWRSTASPAMTAPGRHLKKY